MFVNFRPRLQEGESGGSFLLPPGSTVIVGDGAGDGPKDPGKYSTNDAYSYYTVRDWLQEYFEVGATTAGALVNQYGREFFDKHGRWPQPFEMYQYDTFTNAAARTQNNTDLLPDFFVMDDMPFINTPETGVLPVSNVGAFEDEFGFLDRVQGLGTSPGFIRNLFQNQMKAQGPRLTSDQVLNILNMKPPSARTGGGGGGGIRRDPVFDKATIAESMRNVWRFYLKNEPGEKLDGLVNDYVKEATAFARQGGSLGLDAWIRGRIREQDRYDFLYADKPEHVDEAQWLSMFEQPARQRGLRESSVIREIERGASQNIGAAGFQNQLDRLPEVRAQGGFSRSLASTVAELGVLGRT
jgi:hypothetical protein